MSDLWIVTGGAGFIGSNLVRALNRHSHTNILIVDPAGLDAANLRGLQFSDLISPADFRELLAGHALPEKITAILHQGACADTTCDDEPLMMDNNVAFPTALLEFALKRKIPFVYASSAAVYGANTKFREEPRNEAPLNLYGRSKLIFDNHVRTLLPSAASTVAGLRYFNVYGPRETHKGRMASMVYQLYKQLCATGFARLFEGSGGYAAGEQRRDFVSVEDVVRVNLRLAEGSARKGIFNVGTGHASKFNDVARALIQQLGRGEIQYVPFPSGLRERYQNYTQADTGALRGAGYTAPFVSLEDGIATALPFWQSES